MADQYNTEETRLSFLLYPVITSYYRNKNKTNTKLIKSKYSAITILLYTCVTHHNKKKKHIICSFSWQIGKTKDISREMSPFLFNFNFWITTKYIKDQKKIPKKIPKKYFQKNNLKKKVVPAI